MKIPLKVICVEDSEGDSLLLLKELERGGYAVTSRRVETSEALQAALDAEAWDVVLIDYNMPLFSGLEALALLKRSGLDIPFILVSGSIGEELAVQAMHAGAHDYIMKDHLARLAPAIDRELKEVRERRARRHAQEMINRLAWYDPVTGLPNRILLHKRVREALGNALPVALLLIDLDRFKEINDTLGHSHGDSLLKQVGRRLDEVVGKGGTLAHLGGDEFAVLLPEAGRKDAEALAARLHRTCAEPFPVSGLSLDVSFSIGIALAPEHGVEAELLLRKADVAMYAAKDGHTDTSVYQAEGDTHTQQRLTLLTELRQALSLENGDSQLLLHYQPKVGLAQSRLVGVESLVRWRHPRQGLLSPMDFVPLAERTSLIRMLTAWVLRHSLAQSRFWRRARVPLKVAVNLSARDLDEERLPEQVASLLREFDIPPESLELELTESALMKNPQASEKVLDALDGLGVALSIDDFGTGYSSLAYLKRLPVDSIKIDQSFVKGMARDQDAALIVRSTVNLGHDLGLTVVAEGVEDRETLDFLKSMGCDVAQGYFLSCPLDADDLGRWRAKHAPGATP